MKPERWAQIKPIFHAAAERPADERAAFIRSECNGDESLAVEIESLLAAHDQAGSFIEGFPSDETTVALENLLIGPMIGQQIGPYKVIRMIGRGGMGEVYLAQDGRLGRKVALKLLPAHFTALGERVRRFEQEARSASSLNHPNIITVHDIGEIEGRRYLVTEYVEGETLRQRMESAPQQSVKLSEALEVATQVAAALAAAHEAGIAHRDIKPENIMLRPDGLVKVLDFGLAKLTEPAAPAIGTEASAIGRASTESGVVMGTPRYMSPEQARGQRVDARTDIWSLGVLLYEMASGRPPFEGTTADVLSMILHREPPSLLLYSSDMPAELERIVTKTLRKDREERYQVVKDLALDLKSLKQRMEFEAELERSTPPEERSAARRGVASGGRAAARAGAVTDEGAAARAGAVTDEGAAQTGGARERHTPSSAEYIAGEIRRHKQGVGLTAAVVLALIVAAGAFLFSHRAPALTEKDTILVADFVNTTGDAVFDGTLKQGLAVQLAQSPFLNIFPETRVRQTLRLMNRAPEERVTKDVAREICQRQGVKAYLAGSISSLGSNYVITLEGINAQSGEEMAREQVEATSKEGVLKALSQAATRLREGLGESLQSIQKFDTPLEVTTSSLEALKAFSLGREQELAGKFLESIPFFQRAVEIDPNFAAAWLWLSIQYSNTNQPELAAQYVEKAFALRDRVSEYEKLRISMFYYDNVTGEVDKAIETQELFKRSYPRDHSGPGNLSHLNPQIGQFEKAVAEAQEAIHINPSVFAYHTNLMEAFIRLNRFAEAEEVCAQAMGQKLDGTNFHAGLYEIAFVRGDAAAMQQQLDWAKGRPDEYAAVDWQTETAAFAGHYRRSQDFSRRAVDAAVHGNAKEVAAQYTAEAALRSAAFGQCQQAKAPVAQALALERSKASLTRGALALALCGEAGQAQSIIDELTKRYPKDTLINSLWLPTIRAAVETNRNNPAGAIQLLETAKRYEGVGEFWPQTLRGHAYLRVRAGAEARSEFQKILDHRGYATISALYPLAHLGLARAAAMTGDAATARTAYQNFLALWKDADPDLPVLQEAKREYETVK